MFWILNWQLSRKMNVCLGIRLQKLYQYSTIVMIDMIWSRTQYLAHNSPATYLRICRMFSANLQSYFTFDNIVSMDTTLVMTHTNGRMNCILNLYFFLNVFPADSVIFICGFDITLMLWFLIFLICFIDTMQFIRCDNTKKQHWHKVVFVCW